MYLSLMFSHDEMQFEIYRWMNSVGRSTAVVNLHSLINKNNNNESKDKPVDDLHGVKGHVHGHKDREVLRDLRGRHELEKDLNGNEGVVLYKVRKFLGREATVVHQLGVSLQLAHHLLHFHSRLIIIFICLLF